MPRNDGPPRPDVVKGDRKVGTFIAYGRDGSELTRIEDFEIGRTKPPRGLGMGMSASVVIDPKSGERLHRWDPWDVLK